MDTVLTYLRLARAFSYIVGDAGIVASAVLMLYTLRSAGQVPYTLLMVELAFPFVAALGALATGDMFGLLLEIGEQAAPQLPDSDHPTLGL